MFALRPDRGSRSPAVQLYTAAAPAALQVRPMLVPAPQRGAPVLLGPAPAHKPLFPRPLRRWSRALATPEDTPEPNPAALARAEATFEALVTCNKIMIFGADSESCKEVANILNIFDIPFDMINMDLEENGNSLRWVVAQKTGQQQIPQIFFNARHLGGLAELVEMMQRNEFFQWYEPERYAQAAALFNQLISEHEILVIGGSYCPYCSQAKQWLDERGYPYHYIETDKVDEATRSAAEIASQVSGQQTIPNIFIKGEHLGGYDKLIGEEFISLYVQ
mmetsp:Transcript_144930/g.252768  ORF Transcript_144930/g.252768 Transcript_144930/m.252768 type:complete len:277 (+) Transcript_144930:1962-2792(+)